MSKKKRPSLTEMSKLPENPLSRQDFVSNEYVRLFVSSGIRKQLSKLSGAAAKLLLWIMQEMENGKDWVYIDKERYMQECGIKSIKTVRAALADMCKHQFIAEIYGNTDTYFINTSVFSFGPRIHKQPSNMIKYNLLMGGW